MNHFIFTVEKDYILGQTGTAFVCTFRWKLVFRGVNVKYQIIWGRNKSKGKIHLTALIDVTESNFTYHFSTQSPCNTMCYIVQLVSVFLGRRSFSAALVVLCAQCWWPTRTTFISNTCSTRFKPFHPLINLPTYSWCCVHTEPTYDGEFPQVSLLLPKQTALRHAVLRWCNLAKERHVLALVAATRLKAERCAAHGWTLQQALSILRNAAATLCPG